MQGHPPLPRTHQGRFGFLPPSQHPLYPIYPRNANMAGLRDAVLAGGTAGRSLPALRGHRWAQGRAGCGPGISPLQTQPVGRNLVPGAWEGEGERGRPRTPGAGRGSHRAGAARERGVPCRGRAGWSPPPPCDLLLLGPSWLPWLHPRWKTALKNQFLQEEKRYCSLLFLQEIQGGRNRPLPTLHPGRLTQRAPRFCGDAGPSPPCSCGRGTGEDEDRGPPQEKPRGHAGSGSVPPLPSVPTHGPAVTRVSPARVCVRLASFLAFFFFF